MREMDTSTSLPGLPGRRDAGPVSQATRTHLLTNGGQATS
jgi:hypothetical protein